MIAKLRPIATPISYLRIQHSFKPWYDWYFPVGIVLLSWGLLNHLDVNSSFFTLISSKVAEVCSILVGFCLAALAAVATFPNEKLDDSFKGEPAKLNRLVNGVKVDTVLSRRQFLCYLFGYLSLSCLILIFSISIFSAFPEVKMITIIFRFLYSVLTIQVLFAFLLGLHYLTDRMHR